MTNVYVYKTSSSEYRVEPGVVVLDGGDTIRVINATAAKIKVVVPKGAAKPPNTRKIGPAASGDFRTKSQGHGKIKAYSYKVSTSSGKKAHGNSDPILIIEN